MGNEARCEMRLGRKKSIGKALLESNELIFRGDTRVVIPFKEIRSAHAEDGELTIVWPQGTAVFQLGEKAAAWAKKILHPKSRLDKLGVKAGQRVSVVGVNDDAFIQELAGRTDDARLGRIVNHSAIVFAGATTQKDLGRLDAARRAIEPDGAIWVVWPKGRRTLTEDHVRAAALRRDLVDVKVVAFSKTLSALKLVIPVAKR